MEKIKTDGIVKRNIFSRALCVLGFFVGRVVIFSGTNPIVIGYLSTLLFKNSFLPTAILAFLGLISQDTGLPIFRYVAAILILTIINQFLHLRKNQRIRAIIGAAALLVGGLIFAALEGFSLYFAIIAVVEAVLSYALCYVLRYATDLFTLPNERKLLSHEEIISLSIIICSLLAGMNEINLGIIRLCDIGTLYFMLLIAFKGGAALGSGACGMLSAFLALCNIYPIELCPVFTLAGASGGAVNKKGKGLSAICFSGVMIIALYCFYQRIATPESLFSLIAAIVLFALTPDKLYLKLSNSVDIGVSEVNDYLSQLREITGRRLKDYAMAYKRLATCLTSLSDDEEDFSLTLPMEIQKSLCVNCRKKKYCWEENRYETYQGIFAIFSWCEASGNLNPDTLPRGFCEACVSSESFIEEATRLYERDKQSKVMENRLEENRQLILSQLKAMSSSLERLSQNLNYELNLKTQKSKRITEALCERGLPVVNSVISENAKGQTEIMLSVKPCYRSGLCQKEIIPCINELLGKRMCRLEYDCTISNYPRPLCKLRLVEEKPYSVLSCARAIAKVEGEVSGDSHLEAMISYSTQLLCLSDGMGSGKRARKESEITIELFEQFIEAGFEKETAIDIINTALVFKPDKESYSTLDICAIDLYSGEADFLKTGACPSFIIRNTGEIEEVKSSSLPVGIVERLEVERYSLKLYGGDKIIMLTDGILEALGDSLNSEKNLIEILEENKSKPYQQLAGYIIERAEQGAKKNSKDDMTIICAEIII